MYDDKEQMIDDQILSKFLDNAVAKAKKRIEEEGRIETEDAIPLMLKSQFNHIAHLETKMVTKDEFNARFGHVEKELSFIKWLIVVGFALLACLPFFFSFTK